LFQALLEFKVVVGLQNCGASGRGARRRGTISREKESNEILLNILCVLALLLQNYDDYGDDFGDDCGDDEDGLVDDRVNFEASAPESGNRLACLNGYADLIDEEPQVENISLAYETIAKRVDVRQLKQNLWKKVMPLKSDETTDDQSEGEEDAAPAEKCVSFLLINAEPAGMKTLTTWNEMHSGIVVFHRHDGSRQRQCSKQCHCVLLLYLYASLGE